MKRTFFKNLSLIIALIVVVYLIGNNTTMLKSSVMQILNIPGSSVQGVSTERAQEVSEKIKSDLGAQAVVVGEKILDLTIGDGIEAVLRLQKIPQDFRQIEQYTKEKVNDMLKFKK